MQHRTAKQIYQANLDAISKALMSGDLRLMLDHVGLPKFMATHDTEMVISSAEELDLVMQDFHGQLLERGVSDYRRTCIEADYAAGRDDMIAGRHRTEAFGKDGTTVITPYVNHMVLMLIRGRWRGVWVQAETKNTSLQILSPDIAEAQAAARRVLESSSR